MQAQHDALHRIIRPIPRTRGFNMRPAQLESAARAAQTAQCPTRDAISSVALNPSRRHADGSVF